MRAGFAARVETRFDGVVRILELSRQRPLAVDVVLVAGIILPRTKRREFGIRSSLNGLDDR